MEIEIRTWPEQTDLIVYYKDEILSHYDQVILSSKENSISNPLLNFPERSSLVIKDLQKDQDFLQACLNKKEAVNVSLDLQRRKDIDNLLQKYNLTLDACELKYLKEVKDYLQVMSLEDLYQFLVDWHNLIEKEDKAEEDPNSWIHKSLPENCYLFHYLTKGLLSPEENDDEAFLFFWSLIDHPLEDFKLGYLLRSVYFSRAEFKDREIPQLKALQELEAIKA